MKCVAVLLAVLVGSAAGSAVNPIQQVMSLLADLKEKVTKDGAAEDGASDKYSKFCVKEQHDVSYEIKTGEKTVEELAATIGKASADMETSDTRGQELLNTISANEGDLSAAAEVRKNEVAESKAAETELKDSIDMLGRAISTLSKKP
ncbi:unnamed protein product [Polarella glacialis]|uniref:Uncharacterized protein n=1 Tax=Polarella glacialis TaxID=89957 RepID=A0A813K1E7_POLGL|nr:unnamed protein product [Polarella glacialis]